MGAAQNKRGCLDGLTLLRFTYAFDSGGGIEQYLSDLNSALLDNHNMTIIQVHYKKGVRTPERRAVDRGKGKIVYVAVPPAIPAHQEWNGTAPKDRLLKRFFRSIFREKLLYNPVLEKFFLTYRKCLAAKPLGMGADEASSLFNDLLKDFKIDMIMFHCLGGFDTACIIEIAKEHHIPYAYMNHYANDKFKHVCIREQLRDASGVAGVSSCALPKYIRKKFVTLHDGIDVNFFSRDRIPHFSKISLNNTVLLPARICVGKGHADLLEAAALLKKEGTEINIVFAGRNDSEKIYSHIHAITHKHGLSDNVILAGQRSAEQLRNLYGQCSVIVLPSRSEGFARVLLEAQAMSTPVIAYNVGGVSQTMIHGESGLLCKFKNIKGLKDALKKLLTNESLRKSMGETGRQFVVNNFTIEHLAAKHQKYYSDILNNAKLKQKE
jgi:glycosyltransferase involved in cell wall biosynthesis